MSEVRAFIAIEIPRDIRKKLFTLGHEVTEEGVKPTELDNLHITVKFLGDCKWDRISQVRESLARLKYGKFNVSIEGVGCFPNPDYIKVLWAGCRSEKLHQFASLVNSNLEKYFPKEPLTPHITFARVKRNLDFSHFLDHYKNEKFGKFKVESFSLKQSQLTRSGPIYSDIEQFPLVSKEEG